jgi:hypothetical protein
MKTGMLRIRYKDRKTVFEYRDMTREDAEEQVVGHAQRFCIETVTIDKKPVRREIDQSTLIAEWVEHEGESNEKVTRLRTPWHKAEDAGPAERGEAIQPFPENVEREEKVLDPTEKEPDKKRRK